MISVANGLGKTIEMIDPVKLLAVQKVSKKKKNLSSFPPSTPQITLSASARSKPATNI